MAERWINQSEQVLKTLEKLASKEDRDRLEIINTMILAINATDSSLHGWRSWISNLGFMSRFTTAELTEIEAALLKLTRAYVEYAIEVTKKHQDKIPKIRYTASKKEKARDSRGIYV